jgi:hypothetical protein
LDCVFGLRRVAKNRERDSEEATFFSREDIGKLGVDDVRIVNYLGSNSGGGEAIVDGHVQ